MKRLLLVLLLLALPRTANADDALARQYFKKGIDLYDKKQYAEARAAFEDAYREKPTASLKQNIGLCWKGLGKPALAASAFDEALGEGKTTLKPDTRAAIEHELAELGGVVATLRVLPTHDVTLTIESAGESPRTVKVSERPIRLMPGTYTLHAHMAGQPDPLEKHLALVSGTPVEVTFVFGDAPATLTVKASRPDATIRVDGVLEPTYGTWSGTVAPGMHELEVSSDGFKSTHAEVTVAAGASVEYPVKLFATSEAPPEYSASPLPKPPKKRGFYMTIMGTLEATGYRLSDDVGERSNGFRRNFAGLSVALRGGYHVTQLFALDLHLEAGGVSSSYKLHPTDANDTKTDIVHWQITPEVRYVGPGKVRFTSGTGFGLHGLSMKTAEPNLTKRGSGVAFSWLLDAGLQAEMSAVVFFELLAFIDVHGVGPVRDEGPPGDRFLLASPAVRAGVRIGLGIPF